MTAAAVARHPAQEVCPDDLGPAFDDVQDIRGGLDSEIELSTSSGRSAFCSRRSMSRFRKPDAVDRHRTVLRATASSGESRCRPIADYYVGKPAIDRIVFRAVRLGPVGVGRNAARPGRHAVRSRRRRGRFAEPSSPIKVFSFERPYAYDGYLELDGASRCDTPRFGAL